jgi:hypothetical protein
MTPAMPRTRVLVALPALAVALGVGGCGVVDPYQQHTTAASTSTSSTTPSGPRTPSSAAPGGGQGASGPVATLARYAYLATNWTSHTLSNDQQRLAALSRGGARAQALQTAVTYGHASSLQHSKVTNTGQVTSIARGRGVRRGDWVITTEEHTGGSDDYAGLPAQAHIYYARLVHVAGGWAVSTWSPQN